MKRPNKLILLVALAAFVASGVYVTWRTARVRKGYEPHQPIHFPHDRMAGEPKWETDENGEPALRAPLGTSVTELTHLVFTRSREGVVRLYIDGIVRASEARAGDFSNWDPGFRLALGNEFTKDRTWEGRYHLVAIYQRALDADEVLRNYRAGF